MRFIVRWLTRIVLGVLAAFCLLYFILWFTGILNPADFTWLKSKKEMSVIYYTGGERAKEYCTFCREIIPLNKMGKFPEFAVAVEDKNFSSRVRILKLRFGPLDFMGFLRAGWLDVRTHSFKEGASTIEQQLVGILDAEESREKKHKNKLLRKLRKIWLAVQLSRRFSKEQILESYLNSVYCGDKYGGVYGVEACSEYYYGKHAAELDAGEVAVVVGRFRKIAASPFVDPVEAKKLRSRVLEQLFDGGKITKEERSHFAEASLPKQREENLCGGMHAAEFVRRQVVSKHPFADQGLHVTTTLDCKISKVADEALKASMKAMQERNPELTDLRGEAVLIDARTGALTAFVQEPGVRENQYLADQIMRQLGSVAKEFFYATWLEKGGRLSCGDEGTGPCTLDDSSSLSISMGGGRGAHTIENFPYPSSKENPNPRYLGIAEPLICIGQSRNACTMSGVRGVRGSRAQELVSKEEILQMMVRLGVHLPSMNPALAASKGIALIPQATAKKYGLPSNTVDPGLTVAIGSIEASPYDMARAGTGFAGGLVEPYAVTEIKKTSGESVFRAQLQPPAKVFEGRVALAMMRGLRATVELPHGTAQSAKRELDFPIFGKTGTATNSDRGATDNWFAGGNQSYYMVVHIGRDKKLPMKPTPDKSMGGKIPETGGRNALPVVIKTLKFIYTTRSKEQFPEETDPLKPLRFSKPETQAIENTK